jgi:hypothetical protein
MLGKDRYVLGRNDKIEYDENFCEGKIVKSKK